MCAFLLQYTLFFLPALKGQNNISQVPDVWFGHFPIQYNYIMQMKAHSKR